MKKKLIMGSLIAVVLILVFAIVKYKQPSNMKRFLNYNENNYMGTRFDNVIESENETRTCINTYRRIDNNTIKNARKKESLKDKDDEYIINFFKTENEKAKYNVELLKSLKNLEEDNTSDFGKEDLSIGIIIENNKIFNSNKYIQYNCYLKVYLKEKLILLEDHGNMKSHIYSGKSKCFKMDDETLALAEYVISTTYNVSDDVLNVKEGILRNLVANMNELDLTLSRDYSKNVDEVNNGASEEYARGIQQVKEFCNNNSLKLTYVEPIEDRISRVAEHATQSDILTNLYNKGAESVNYFTDEEALNVDLSISFIDYSEENYSEVTTIENITYKAAMSNIDGSFNFQESKLNEFRLGIINNGDELDYKSVDEYIMKCISGVYSKDIWFINKIDNNYTEFIRVENNIVYYKLVYNY